jgi:hypothetical protein
MKDNRAIEDEGGLVVLLIVIARTAGRDPANELGYAATANCGAHHEPELPVLAGRVGWLIGKPHSHLALAETVGQLVGDRRKHADQNEVFFPLALDRVVLLAGHVRSNLGLQLMA